VPLVLVVSSWAGPVCRRAFLAANRFEVVELIEASNESLGTHFSVGLWVAPGAPFIRDAATPGPGQGMRCDMEDMRLGGFMEFKCT
jgi:hypothetical protein